jgi:hypothetical protein
MADTFNIINAKFSRSNRILFGAANAIIGLVLSLILLMICVPLIPQLTDNKTISILITIVLAFIFPAIMLYVEKKITNAYYIIGLLDFKERSLSIKLVDIIDIDYCNIRMVYLSTTLQLGKAIISFTTQIVTSDNRTFTIHIYSKSNSLKVKSKLFFLKSKKDIFDVLNENQIRHKWIRKINYSQHGQSR